jgi:thiosulfate/3-mercaptopyruvate sulfurtransferase
MKARIPGSRHADLTTAFNDPAKHGHFAHPTDSQLVTSLFELGVRDGDEVVTYDRNGGIWSARLWWMLRSIGVEVRVLDGGWSEWLASGSPVSVQRPEEGGHAQSPPRTGNAPVVGRTSATAWVSLTDVQRIVAGQRSAQLLCALGPSTFEGTAPTRYARRGHIPGSTNLPARALVDDRDRLLPLPELISTLGPLLNDERPLVLYCGGGISACLLALALVRAGRDDVAVYDGSLEEWTADPRLPIALGPEPLPRNASIERHSTHA